MKLLSRLKESSILQLLVVPLSLVCWKYSDGSITDVTDFAQAISTLIAIYLAREVKESHYAK